MPRLADTKSDYTHVKIPEELVNFLRQETYTLIIKGHAGTGKTTLALTILRELQIKSNCLYISTRISPEQLFQYYPWLERTFDSSKRTKLTDASSSGDGSLVFVDARLDEPGSLFERVTNELMDVKAPTIIIDTWDAIEFFLDKEALMNNARVLQTWRERAGAKLIFVTESPEDTTFDFLADGVVELRQGLHNDRRVREILMSKLRGIRVDRPSYIYSLNGGVFRSYSQYRPKELDGITISKNQLNYSSNVTNAHIPSGYEELDELFGGGFPSKGTILLEIDTHVNTQVVLAFLDKIISGFMYRGNPVLFQPFEGMESEQADQHLKPNPDLKSKSIIEIFSNGTRPRITDYLSSPKYDEDKKRLQLFQNTVRRLRTKYKKGLLSIVGSDIMHGFSKTENGRQGIQNLVSFIRSNSDLAFFIFRRSDKQIDYLSEFSDIHLKLLEINGVMFLQSENPWSHLYAINLTNRSDYNEITLEPIV